jgi:predicted DNA-binding protein
VEDTIVVTSADLSEHAMLLRKKTETAFRISFLLRKGSAEDEAHVQSLKKQLVDVEGMLKPIQEKIERVDILTVIPNRKEIDEITSRIEQYSKEQLDEAMRSRSGEIYELLKKRAVYTKANYENKETVARLTILLNKLARSQSQILKNVIEASVEEDVDLSSVDEAQRQDLVSMLGRIGKVAYVVDKRLTLDKKKVDGIEYLSWPTEIKKTICAKGEAAKTLWVPRGREERWEENEKELSDISRRIQVMITKRQAIEFDDEQHREFENLQKRYIELRRMRNNLASQDEKISVSLKRREEQRRNIGELEKIDLGPEEKNDDEGERIL